jgi:hypothetical protein
MVVPYVYSHEKFWHASVNQAKFNVKPALIFLENRRKLGSVLEFWAIQLSPRLRGQRADGCTSAPVGVHSVTSVSLL